MFPFLVVNVDILANANELFTLLKFVTEVKLVCAFTILAFIKLIKLVLKLES